MQVFLKKIFRKDIVAIAQNMTGVILNWLRHTSSRIMIGLKNTTNRFTNWFKRNGQKIKTWLKNKITNLKTRLQKIINPPKAKETAPNIDKRLLTPIIVYQSGKVGSVTVLQSLKKTFEKLNLSTPVYHTHSLNHIEVVEEAVKKTRQDPTRTLKQLEESKALRQKIDADRSQKWNIINLVRDPVAIRVSMVFQLLGEYYPNWAELTRENKLTINDLQHIMLTRKEFDPAILARWFNNQVKDLFKFDVFATPFDTEKGFKIYKPNNSRFSFMIIRLEDLDRVAPDAFQNFLGLDQFRIINQNIGEKKPYSELYKQFKSTPLPVEYLDAAYKTQYARHFYTPQELDAFRNRWLHPQIKKDE